MIFARLNPGRSLSIDVLRGTAILLVLFRHHPFIPFLERTGWIGVDLFFVLSGYLVSGLLFKEYQRHGDIAPWRFLIRRGFKIYPTFYALLPLAVWINIAQGRWSPMGLLSELVFMQNYLFGLGWWPTPITWSLAIEEHFYFGLCLALFWASRRSLLSDPRLARWIAGLMAFCLGLRLFSHHVHPLVPIGGPIWAQFTETHFRYDELLAGVLIAWLETNRRVWLTAVMAAFRPYLFPCMALLLCFVPFTDVKLSTFTQTFGLTMIYTAFGLLLASVITDTRPFPNNRFTRWIGAIGQWSYAIYLVHALIVAWVMKLEIVDHVLGDSTPLRFLLYFALSIGAGAVVSTTWEQWWLRLRDRWFPGRHLSPAPAPAG